MSINEQCSRLQSLSLHFLVVAVVLVLAAPLQRVVAQSQWTTNGNNINNTNTGNVGIGTSSPAQKLSVVGTGSTTSGYSLGLFDSGSTVNAGNVYGIGINKNTVEMLMLGINKNTASGSVPANASFLSTWGSAGTISIGRGGNNGLPGTSDFFINSSGNVGIGTTAPTYRLDIQAGAINASGGLCIAGDCKTAWSQVGASSQWTTSSSSLYYNTGNVGIGTSTPSFKLDVAGQVRSSSGGFVFPDGTVQATAATGGGGTVTGVVGGAGLTGGGTSGTVTLNVGAGTGLSVAADSISVNYGSTAGTAVQGNTSITVSPGAGMSGGGPITLGGGGSVTLTNSDPGSSQSIFKNVANAAGTTQFSAGSNSDALRFEGTGGISVSFDPVGKKVIINSSTSGATLSASNVSAGQFGLNTGGGDFSFPANVTVAGNINAKYQDVAEWVPSREKLEPGTVVALDLLNPNHVLASSQAYDTAVAGVISETPGVILGEAGEGKVKVATTGRVRVKVNATRAAIKIGDLLVTSNTPGVAMKSEPITLGGRKMHTPGTIIGKALEPIENGMGEILVLLSLQ